jgi:hypothetical protein
VETAEMGRVTTEATIYNVHDLEEAEAGKLPPEQVRKVVVTRTIRCATRAPAASR